MWTPARRELVKAVEEVAYQGDLLAVASARGEGKSAIIEGCTLKLTLTGVVDFSLIVAATGPFALRMLNNVKFHLETSERLAKDYPEVLTPIQALEGIPQRAASQTVAGVRTRCVWAGNHVILPTVEGSAASGAVIASVGIDGALRGYNVRGRRPRLVIVDDPDTRESSRSLEQTEKRAQIIESDIAGLGEGDRPAAIVMLANTPTRISIGYTFTDRSHRPSWRGRRFPQVVQWPTRADLWDQYVALRQESLGKGDPLAREADRFYLRQRKEMDAGVVLSNPKRYRGDLAEDGKPLEWSAIQAVYKALADRGSAYVAAELNCDPPEDASVEGQEGLTVAAICRQQTTSRRGEIPDRATVLTLGVDVGKHVLHWVVVAWERTGRGWIVDYDAAPVASTETTTVCGAEFLVSGAIERLLVRSVRRPLGTGATARLVDRAFVDVGYLQHAVYNAIREVGSGVVFGCKGTGDSLTGAGDRHIVRASTKTHHAGDHWDLSWLGPPDDQYLVRIDSDYWKRWIRDRLSTSPEAEASVTLFAGVDAADNHRTFAEHLANERWDPVKNKWDARKRNHWGDALYYAAAAASQCGVSVLPLPQLSQASWSEQAAQQRQKKRRGQPQR